MGEPNNVQSVDRAIDIIEFLYRQGKEASISEISKETGLSASTIHRQLSTLKSRGFIYQNPDNSKYYLGIRLYMIGNKLKNDLPNMTPISTCAESIAKKYQQSVFIAIPDYSSSLYPRQRIIIRKSFNPVPEQNEIEAGMVLPCHNSATGKCMMAYYPDELIQQYKQMPLEKITDKTITDWSTLLAELSSIRSRGYALDSDEEQDGRTCIAVPIKDDSDNIMASISLSGQTKSMFEIPVNAIVRDLNEVAGMIAKKM